MNKQLQNNLSTKIYMHTRSAEPERLCVCVNIFVKEAFTKKVKLQMSVQGWIINDRKCDFISYFIGNVQNAIHAFVLLTLISAQYCYPHFTDEKPEIHKLNVQH